MLPASLISNTTTAYIIAKYLQDFCQHVGTENYLASPVRYQHGNGTGGFRFSGVGQPQKRLSASGNNDCVKERFRGITDSLELTFRTIDKIKFRTASCVALRERRKNQHRVEHTNELIDIYHDFENQYIITNKHFTPNILAKFVLQQTIVCLIEQREQKAKGTYDLNIPFSKYSAKVFYNGIDVSDCTKHQVMEITQKEYSHILDNLHSHDFGSEILAKHTKLIASGGHHSLPPMDIAVKYYNNPFGLLENYYHHQRKQLIEEGFNPLYFNADLVKDYKKWKKTNKVT